jgi:hypothetical protein
MSNGAPVGGGAAAGAAGAAAAIAKAIKASGTIVKVDSEAFMTILYKIERPLVVTAKGGFLKRDYVYLTSYKGLAFYTKSPQPLGLPGAAELIAAKKIWIP